MKELKFRHKFTIVGIIIALFALFGTEPGIDFINLPFGADVLAKLSGLPAAVFGVTILYVGIKGLFDFVDRGKIYEKAIETPLGAGLAMLSISVAMVAIALITMGMLSIFIP